MFICHPEDWDWHRFFYTLPGRNQRNAYLELKSISSETEGSPDACEFALKIHALLSVAILLMAAIAILDHSIVDDGLVPVKDQVAGKRLVSELVEFAAGLGMTVHKWASNDPSILPPGTPQRDLVELNSHDLDAQYPEGKALGIVWHTRTDEMSFAPLKPVLAPVWTKRVALSCLMSFYSPDGLGLPLEMAGRFLFRQTWELGLHWDEPINSIFTKRWKAWEHQMGHVGHIRYPRSVGSTFHEIHIFCDASGEGYGAAAYVKTDLGVFLCYAKGKIVKSISQTIPTLEMEACVVGKKMVPKLLRVYPDVSVQNVHYHTDADNVLTWIKVPGRDLPRPIARRAAMIREDTLVQNWHHVPTDLNPADILSRGSKAINLVNNKLWWHGPEYIAKGDLPRDRIVAKPHIPMPDEAAMARMVGIFVLAEPRPRLPTLFLVSSFRRGCRIMYYVRLFITKTLRRQDQ